MREEQKKVGNFREKVPNFCAKVERFCVKVAEKKQKRRTFPRKRAALSLCFARGGGKMCAAQGDEAGRSEGVRRTGHDEEAGLLHIAEIEVAAVGDIAQIAEEAIAIGRPM